MKSSMRKETMKDEQTEMFESGATPFTVKVVHLNSIKAYREDPESLSKRAKLVLDWFRIQASPRTDRDCMLALGFSDMNAVRPRITELVQAGLLREAGNVQDPITNKTVRTVEDHYAHTRKLPLAQN